MIINNITLEMGSTIKFSSKSSDDPNVYEGMIVGFGTYDTARMYNDIVAYNEVMKKDYPDTPSADLLDYVIVKLADSGTPIKAFAEEWIEPASFTVVQLGNDFDLRVFNISDDDKATVIRLLQDNNYRCKAI